MIQISAKYSSKVYSPESILLASQEMRDFGSVLLQDGDTDLIAEFTIDDSKISDKEFLHRFNKALSDYHLRIVISEKTVAIRQMIVAQAFAPCDNLGEIVEAVENHAR